MFEVDIKALFWLSIMNFYLKNTNITWYNYRFTDFVFRLNLKFNPDTLRRLNIDFIRLNIDFIRHQIDFILKLIFKFELNLCFIISLMLISIIFYYDYLTILI